MQVARKRQTKDRNTLSPYFTTVSRILIVTDLRRKIIYSSANTPTGHLPQGHTLDKYEHRNTFLLLKGLASLFPPERGSVEQT